MQGQAETLSLRDDNTTLTDSSDTQLLPLKKIWTPKQSGRKFLLDTADLSSIRVDLAAVCEPSNKLGFERYLGLKNSALPDLGCDILVYAAVAGVSVFITAAFSSPGSRLFRLKRSLCLCGMTPVSMFQKRRV